MKRFNLLFPIIFITIETIIMYFVTMTMHYLTFSVWNFYNTLIIIFWIFLNIYVKSYNIGRGVSYLNTIKTAIKSIFILFSVVAIANLFVDYYAPYEAVSIIHMVAQDEMRDNKKHKIKIIDENDNLIKKSLRYSENFN